MSNRIILKNSFYLYIRLVVTMFVGLFTSRYVLSALGVSDFGLYNVVGGMVSMMAFANTIMITTTYRFIAFEQGKMDGDVNKIFNICLTTHLCAALIVLAAALSIGLYYISRYLVVAPGKLPDAYFIYFFSLGYVIIQIIGTPFIGLLVANERFSITVPIEIGTKILILLISILITVLPSNHLRIYVVLITLANIVNPVSYFVYCRLNFIETILWRFQRGWANYKPIFSFAGWNSIEVGALMGESQGSALIINRFFGTLLNASFGVARQVNSTVQMFAKSLNQAVVPQITKSFSSGDRRKSFSLVVLSSKYSFFLMLIPALPILLEPDFILNHWLKEVPQFTRLFVQGMLLKSLIATSQAGIPQLIDATGKIKYFKIITSGAKLLCLPLAYLAYRFGYPAYTITYIFLITAVVNFIVTQVMLSAIIKFNTWEFLRGSTLKNLIVCISLTPLFIISSYLSYGVFRFGVSLFIGEFALFTSIYYLGMSSKERASIVMYMLSAFSSSKKKLGYAKSH